MVSGLAEKDPQLLLCKMYLEVSYYGLGDSPADKVLATKAPEVSPLEPSFKEAKCGGSHLSS